MVISEEEEMIADSLSPATMGAVVSQMYYMMKKTRPSKYITSMKIGQYNKIPKMIWF